MNEELLASMGATKEDLDNATDQAVGDGFKPLDSGAYTGQVKSIIKYTNQWGGTSMVYTFDVDGKELKYGGFDISEKLATGLLNPGWLGRLKQVIFATASDATARFNPTPITFKNFGKDTEGEELQGCAGKNIMVLVRHTNDANKEEGESYKYGNNVAAVVPMDGVDASGENAKEKFLEQAAKTPIFVLKGKKKAKTLTATPAATQAADTSDF